MFVLMVNIHATRATIEDIRVFLVAKIIKITSVRIQAFVLE